MYNEKACLEKLKHIVSEYADDENFKNLSLDQLQSSFAEIADNMYCISVSNQLKYKNMLWNFNNLKTDVRSKFQTELFNTWHSTYIKSASADPSETHPEMIEHESTPVGEVGKIPAVDAKEQPSGITKQQPVESINPKNAATRDYNDFRCDMKLVEKQSPMAVSKVSVPKFEDDWFDKLLDFFAAMVGKK